MEERDTEPRAGSSEGPVILVVGILGLFMQALGPVAWIWGNHALKRAKPAEAGLIQAGRFLGILDTILLILIVVVGIAYYIFAIQFYRSTFNDMFNAPPAPVVHAPAPAHKPAHPKAQITPVM